MFGSSGGMFGNTSFTSNTPAFGGTTFGATTFGSNNGPDGTTIAFEPLRGTDTMIRNGDNKEIQTKNMCITSMEQYKMKSIEELRVADYAANRKGNTGASTGGGGLFGGAAKPASGGLFGSTTSSFGQQQQTATGGGLFGSTTNNATTGSTLFGSAAKPAGGGLFGSTTTSAFGQQQQQPATGTSLFGSNTASTGGSLFGSAAKPATGNLFGSNTTSTFGQTQQQPATGGSLFGSTANNATTGSTLFGNSAKPAGSLFGNNTTSTFGQTQQPASGTNLFGTNTNNASSTGGGLFGSAAKPAGGSLFGSNTTSAFGQQQQQPATGGGLFGTNTNNANTGGSLFGSAAKPAGSLFGTNTTSTFGQQQQQPTQQFAAAPAVAPVQPIYLGGKDDENAIKRAILESQLSSLPYGDSPIFKNKSALPGISSSSVLSRNNESSNIQSQLRKLANQALSPTTSPANNTSSNGNTSALNNLSNVSAITSPNTSFTYKPLVGLPSLGFDPGRSQSSLNLSLRSSPQKLSKNNSFLNDSKKQNQSLKSFDVSVLKSSKSNASKPTPAVSTPPTAEDLTPQQSRRRSVCFADVPNLTQVRTTDTTTSVVETVTTSDASLPIAAPKKSILVTPETRRPREISSQPPITPPTFSENTTSDSIGLNSSALNSSILLTEGYYVEPPIEDLEQTLKDGKYFVRGGLTVGRNGYGSVFWPGDFELSSLDFENIISFRSKEVVVYPDDESKPPLGIDLNRPAEVSLERVWPFDKETKEYIKDPTTLGKIQFRARLERACNRMDARFIDYQVTTGTWTFGVSHF